MAIATLQWYARNLPSDDIRLNVSIDVPSVGVFGQDRVLSDADLTAHALSNGRTTWDESDICALAQCVMPEPIEVEP